MTARSEEVSFVGSSGDELHARLDLPRARPRAFALFAHCFTCDKSSAAASRVSRALAEQGVATLRFDFTGLGESDGEFSNTNFSTNVADLVAAADYLREHHRAPGLLVGHSLGGTAVLAAAAQVPEARAVATINAPADPDHVLRLLGRERERIEREGEAPVRIGPRTFTLTRRFVEDLEASGLELEKLGRALLILHAPEDDIVAVDNARRLFDRARHPKSFVALDGANHLLTRREDAAWAARLIAAWATRYVEELEHEEIGAPEEPEVEAEEGRVVVLETKGGKFTQTIAAAHHRLRADEPVSLGGLDSGPSPYDLLLAALGACTSMTLRMYADRKGLALERVRVSLRHDKQHARHGEKHDKKSRLDRIEREIELSGDLPEGVRERLLEIADRCPVHRTLDAGVHIRSRLVDE